MSFYWVYNESSASEITSEILKISSEFLTTNSVKFLAT